MNTKIVVNIGDDTYGFVAEENEQYMRKVAAYVNAKVAEVSPRQTLSSNQRLVLAAMNIADEHLKLKAAYDDLKLGFRMVNEDNSKLKAQIAGLEGGNRAND